MKVVKDMEPETFHDCLTETSKRAIQSISEPFDQHGHVIAKEIDPQEYRTRYIREKRKAWPTTLKKYSFSRKGLEDFDV